MIERILFATDFSPISDRAERYVTEIAASIGAKVLILHAIEPIAGGDAEADASDAPFRGFLANLQEKARERAEGLMKRLTEAGVESQLHVVVDKRWRAVIDAAEAEDVDLIVLGSHAIREEGKVYVGTTSHKVFFATDRPLLVVPHG
jgi:nucleotide-binding universal stress UspA family protein